MDNKNIISAAQARLNFCNEEYVALYKEINNNILEESRNKTSININTEVNPMIRDRVLSDLNELGYKCNYYHHKDKVYTITISW